MSPHENGSGANGPEISVVCAVGSTPGDVPAIQEEVRDILLQSGRSFEFLFVLSGRDEAAGSMVERIRDSRSPIRIFRMASGFGESAAMDFAFRQARGRYVITVPDHSQADPGVLLEMLERLDRGAEVALAYRDPRKESFLARMQSAGFHGLVRMVTRRKFRDLACGIRAMRTDAARKLDLYGDNHRFIPVLALRRGFEIVELPAQQRTEDHGQRLRSPAAYARRILDILNVYFLTRFTRKPLRFFGLVGMAAGIVGFVVCLVLAIQKQMFDLALANRPLLLLGILLIILGVQLTSIGMIGEIIIFFSSRRDTPEVREIRRSGEDSRETREEVADRK